MKTPIERIAEAADARYHSNCPSSHENVITPESARAVAAEVLRELQALETPLIDLPGHICIHSSKLTAYAASLGVELNEKEEGK